MKYLRINLLYFVAQILLVVAFTRLSSYLESLDLYFQFSDLFFGATSNLNIFAILIKLAIPMVAAAVLTFAIVRMSSIGWLFNFDGEARFELLTSIQVGGFFAAFLMSWPLIIHWNILASEILLPYYEVFLIIYFLYAFAYYLLSGVGARLMIRVNKSSQDGDLDDLVAARKIVFESVLSTFSAGIATFVLGGLLNQ